MGMGVTWKSVPVISKSATCLGIDSASMRDVTQDDPGCIV